MKLSRPILFAFAFVLALPPWLKAETAQPGAAENKLRESLRNTMLQLRSSENDKAVAQAALAEAEEKTKALTDQIDQTMKKLAADKAAADKATADLQSKIDDREKQIADLKDAVEKLKSDNKHITDIANTTEAQRAKFEQQNIQLDRRVAEQQTRNTAMFKIANEILARYEKFGLGDALSAREPFTGITRVKLQSLFEDYRDKLADERIKPEVSSASAQKTTPVPDKAAKMKPAAAKATVTQPRS